MARVIWSDAAIAGVEDIRRYIAKHNPAAASRIAKALIAAGETLYSSPWRGSLVPGGRRKLVVAPYLIFYRVTPDGEQVTIAAVVDGRRARR